MSRCAARRGFTLAGETERLAVVDARRDGDRERRGFGLRAATAAVFARFFDHLAGAAAMRARGLDHEETLRVDDLAFTATGAARFDLAAGRCARARARRAEDLARDFDFFGGAPNGFGEREAEVDAQVRTARLATTTARATAEEITEQIAERGEDVFDVREASA